MEVYVSKPFGEQVLAKAFALIEDPDAWAQKTFRLKATVWVGGFRWEERVVARCLDAAIDDAAELLGHNNRGANQARTLIYPLIAGPPHPTSIQQWNDARGRTHAEVLGLLKEAMATA